MVATPYPNSLIASTRRQWIESTTHVASLRSSSSLSSISLSGVNSVDVTVEIRQPFGRSAK
jgi:hypothetical protein